MTEIFSWPHELPKMAVRLQNTRYSDLTLQMVGNALEAYAKKVIGETQLRRFREDAITMLLDEFYDVLFTRVMFCILRDQGVEPDEHIFWVQNQVYDIIYTFMLARVTNEGQRKLIMMMHDLYNPLPELTHEMYVNLADKYVFQTQINTMLVFYLNNGLLVRKIYPKCEYFYVKHFQTRLFIPIMRILEHIYNRSFVYFKSMYDPELEQRLRQEDDYDQALDSSRLKHEAMILIVHLLDKIFDMFLAIVDIHTGYKARESTNLIWQMQTHPVLNKIKEWADMGPSTLLLY